MSFFRLKLNFKRKCINQNTVNDDDTVTNMKSKEIKKVVTKKWRWAMKCRVRKKS